jgi:F-type H+-transporting ATPase subunit epsilon
MIHFELVTMDGVKHKDDVYEVVLPTPDGYIAVFEHHAPLISLASPGVISVRQKAGQADEQMQHYATHGGVIEIADNTIRVLVDEANAAEEINEAEIKKALEEAHKLRAAAKDQISLDHAQQLIDRSAVRLKVADLRRRRRG